MLTEKPPLCRNSYFSRERQFWLVVIILLLVLVISFIFFRQTDKIDSLVDYTLTPSEATLNIESPCEVLLTQDSCTGSVKVVAATGEDLSEYNLREEGDDTLVSLPATTTYTFKVGPLKAGSSKLFTLLKRGQETSASLRLVAECVEGLELVDGFCRRMSQVYQPLNVVYGIGSDERAIIRFMGESCTDLTVEPAQNKTRWRLDSQPPGGVLGFFIIWRGTLPSGRIPFAARSSLESPVPFKNRLALTIDPVRNVIEEYDETEGDFPDLSETEEGVGSGWIHSLNTPGQGQDSRGQAITKYATTSNFMIYQPYDHGGSAFCKDDSGEYLVHQYDGATNGVFHFAGYSR